MRVQKSGLVALIVLLGTTACGGGSSDDDDDDVAGGLQIVNMIVDSPPLNVLVELDGDDVLDQDNVQYRGASSISSRVADGYELSVTFEEPGTGGDATLVDEHAFTIQSETLTRLVLEGTMSNPSVRSIESELEPFKEEDDDDEDIEDLIEVVAYNLTGGTAELYLGSPSSVPGSSSLLETLAATNVSAPKTIDHLDDFRIVVRSEGGRTNLYDSGSIEIPDLTNRLILLDESAGADRTKISVTMTTSSGTVAFSNKAAGSVLKLVNLAPLVEPIELSASSPATLTDIQTAVLGYREAGLSAPVEPGFIRVRAGTVLGTALKTATLSVAEDEFYAVAVGGAAANDLSLEAFVAPVRPVATQIAVQFINGLEETSEEDTSRVDLYALRPTERFSDASPIARQVDFMEAASVYFPATALDVVVTTAGTQTILAGPTRFEAEPGTARIVTVSPADFGGTPNQITVLDGGLE